MKFSIKKGDTIQVMSGRDSSKTGKVLMIFDKKNRVLVEGLNMVKRHRRPRKQNEKGEIVSIPQPMHRSNVLLYCSHCKRGTRMRAKIINDKKIRICAKCDNGY